MSRTVCNITIVCYDFTNNKVRRKVEKTLCDYGVRVQYSLFACRLDSDQLVQLRAKLTELLEVFRDKLESTDSVVVLDRLPYEKIDTVFGHKWPGKEKCEIY